MINDTPCSKLNLIDVASNVQKLKTMHIGYENEKLVSSLRIKQNSKRDSNQFLQKTSQCICYFGSFYSKERRVKQSSS